MGRTETSKGLAPPTIRKDFRAKQARQIINKVIPALLASNARARRGVESSELIVNPGPVTGSGDIKSKEGLTDEEEKMYVKRKGQGRRKIKNEDVEEEGGGKGRGKGAKMRHKIEGMEKAMSNVQPESPPPTPTHRKTRILAADSLTAAHMLTFPLLYPSSPSSPSIPHPYKPRKKQPNICILNMASPLRPGGGVLTGATSQEEFLCSRTCLLPSLSDSYYRLPEYGAVYTPDVLVCRNPLPLSDSKGELSAAERCWIDVVSAGTLRFPELEGEEGGEMRLGRRERDIVEGKMRAVLRVCVGKGVRKVVLRAWGCGAFGCPVRDVAEAWGRVLDGVPVGKGGKGKSRGAGEVENFPELEEVVFAIGNRQMAGVFAQAFGRVEVEDVGGVGWKGEVRKRLMGLRRS